MLCRSCAVCLSRMTRPTISMCPSRQPRVLGRPRLQSTVKRSAPSMKRTRIFLPVLALFALFAFAVKVGDQAPDFTGTDSHGQTHKLSDYRGKFVVLEWHNNGCPFTKKHYESGNMQKLQQEWTSKGVVWFTVISSSPGSQGYVTADQENEYLQKMNAVPTAALLDPKGDIGHLYGV